MYDFLTFNTFIAQKVLLILYYLGAILFPLLALRYRTTLLRRYKLLTKIELSIRTLFDSLQRRDKLIALCSILSIFLLMELFWRVMFEMMIGYFDMHDYLRQLSLHH